jgi:hypothetical protein
MTNIFTAENYFILEVIKLRNSLQTTNILTISNSFNVLIALKKKPLPKNEMTQITQSELIGIHKNIEFMWIPYHVQIRENETADEAALLVIKNIPNHTIENISSNDVSIHIHKKCFFLIMATY